MKIFKKVCFIGSGHLENISAQRIIHTFSRERVCSDTRRLDLQEPLLQKANNVTYQVGVSFERLVKSVFSLIEVIESREQVRFINTDDIHDPGNPILTDEVSILESMFLE